MLSYIVLTAQLWFNLTLFPQFLGVLVLLCYFGFETGSYDSFPFTSVLWMTLCEHFITSQYVHEGIHGSLTVNQCKLFMMRLPFWFQFLIILPMFCEYSLRLSRSVPLESKTFFLLPVLGLFCLVRHLNRTIIMGLSFGPIKCLHDEPLGIWKQVRKLALISRMCVLNHVSFLTGGMSQDL